MASAVPPQKIVSVPFAAPSEPPDTGASTRNAPRSCSTSARCCSMLGETVEQSTMTAPSRMVLAMPSAPVTAASSCGSPGTHVRTRSAPRAASAGEPARAAPSAASGSSCPRSRSWTWRSNPAAMAWRAMAAPIVPSPTTPTVVMLVPPLSAVRCDPRSPASEGAGVVDERLERGACRVGDRRRASGGAIDVDVHEVPRGHGKLVVVAVHAELVADARASELRDADADVQPIGEGDAG